MVEKITNKELLARPAELGLYLLEIVTNEGIINPELDRLRSDLKDKYDDLNSVSREQVVNQISLILLGQTMQQTQEEANLRLKPYKNDQKENRKRLVLGSAATASGGFSTELNHYRNHSKTIGMSEAIETRDISGSKPKDYAVVQSSTGKYIAERKGLNIIDLESAVVVALDSQIITGADLYYKGDALLLLMLCNPDSEVIRRIHEVMSEENPVIEPYNLDPEIQIALLKLANDADIENLDVKSNSPEVANVLTAKSARYPNVMDATKLNYIHDPIDMQRAEWSLSLYGELGFHPDEIPGYWIQAGENMEENIWLALILHSVRYDFEDVYRKPSKGTDGGGQETIKIGHLERDIKRKLNDLIVEGRTEDAVSLFRSNLKDESTAEDQVNKMLEISVSDQDIDWVVEANIDIISFDFEIDQAGDPINFKVETLPSAQIQDGVVQEKITLQLNNGNKDWGGNWAFSKEEWVYFIQQAISSDAVSCEEEEVLGSVHDVTITKLDEFLNRVNTSDRYNQGLVRGSYDMIIGRLGGKFNNRIVVGMGDPNLRANGSESNHKKYDEAKLKYGNLGTAITRNVTPNYGYENTEIGIQSAVMYIKDKYGIEINLSDIELIGISKGWAQIGLIGDDGLSMLSKMLIVERELREMCLIK